MIKKDLHSVTAFAPASSANFFVGFDILGFPFSELGDEVTLIKNDIGELRIIEIENDPGLPFDVSKNTAGDALQRMLAYLKLNSGFDIKIKKGIPVCSGLGGSAASSVAAVSALNAFLEAPLAREELASFAMEAEYLASGEAHADNVVPSLWGEFTLVQSLTPLRVATLPMPDLYSVLIHPDWQISTQSARQALSSTLTIKQHIQQSANLAKLVVDVYNKDWQGLSASATDSLVEPQRATLLPGFHDYKQAALEQGALACSFSGAGPTMIALTASAEMAQSVADAMQQQMAKRDMQSQYWYKQMQRGGATIIKEELQ